MTVQAIIETPNLADASLRLLAGDVPLNFARVGGRRDLPRRAAMVGDLTMVRRSRMPRGGHFAAWEQPRLADEVAGTSDRPR